MTFYENMETEALILLCRDGDDNAFSELARRFLPMLNKVISGYLSPSFSYGEAFSEASVALHRAILSYNTDRRDVTFGLYAKICVNRALLDFSRKLGKQEGHTQNGVDIDMFSRGATVEASLILRERMSEYFKKVRSILSDYEYDVLILYLEGYTTDEISAKLSKTKKSVDNAKARALKHLRDERGIFSDF